MGSGSLTSDPLEGMIEPQSIGYPSRKCVMKIAFMHIR